MDQSGKNSGILTDPSFYHPAFEEAFRFIIDHYEVPERDICIFLPCSMQKPFSTSPSHRIFDKTIFSALSHEKVHLVVFGTCGVVPRELERMYPFTHYRYMLGKCTDPRIKGDFQSIETYRLACYLQKTRTRYRERIAYCLGGFRRAMKQACEVTGVEVRLLPSDKVIARLQRNDLRFSEGSLNMDDYLAEFKNYLGYLDEPDYPYSSIIPGEYGDEEPGRGILADD